MINISFGIVVNLLLFTLIGFWPVYLLVGSENRLSKTIALAPITGYAITSLLSTYLVLLDFPVSQWFPYYVLFWGLINLVFVVVFAVKKKKPSVHPFQLEPDIKWLIGGFLITLVIVALPMILGGTQFVTFRGNATDDVNYVTVARFLDQEPYSWRNTATVQELIDKDVTYPVAIDFLGTRWTTAVVLAFTSHAANVLIYQFDYGYTLLFFIMAFGPAYLIGKKLNFNPLLAFLVAIMVCTGFWAQFVLDLRAFSEISSVPLILTFAFLFIQLVETSSISKIPAVILLGIISASLVFSYTEIVPSSILSIFIFLVFLILNQKTDKKVLPLIGITLLLTALLIAPLFTFIRDFIIAQVSYAATGKNYWDQDFFTWLYTHNLIGFWGFIPFTFIDQSIPFTMVLIYRYFFSTICVGLSLVTLGTTLLSFFRKITNTAVLAMVAFVLGTVIEFLYLYCSDQLWAAGKALAYGYPFFLLLVVGGAFTIKQEKMPVFISKGLQACVWIWLVLQLSLGVVARNVMAVTGVEYKEYIKPYEEIYRAYDYNLSPIETYLEDKKGSVIWTGLANVWVNDYIHFAFNQDYQLVNMLPVKDYYRNEYGYQSMDSAPQYLFVSRDFLLSNREWANRVVAENTDFVLLVVDNPDFSISSITLPE